MARQVTRTLERQHAHDDDDYDKQSAISRRPQHVTTNMFCIAPSVENLFTEYSAAVFGLCVKKIMLDRCRNAKNTSRARRSRPQRGPETPTGKKHNTTRAAPFEVTPMRSTEIRANGVAFNACKHADVRSRVEHPTYRVRLRCLVEVGFLTRSVRENRIICCSITEVYVYQSNAPSVWNIT